MNNLGVKVRETMDVEVKPLPYAAEIIEDESFEMANLNPPTTGLRQRIWVSSNLQVSHNRPRLRIKASDVALYPVSVDEPIEFLAGWAPGLSAADFKTL